MTTILNQLNPETDLKRKIVIVTDAWHPQVNGVVRTVEATRSALRDLDHDVEVMNPSTFRTLPCPTYPDIRFAVDVWPRVGRMIRKMRPDSILIATEGPLGLAARNFCISEGLHFSTNFSTKFPEYIRLRAPIPESWSYKYFRWFHTRADSVLVATRSLETYLHERGIKNTNWWSLGVDTDLFKPYAQSNIPDVSGPILLYVGRIAVEKNVKSFLDLNIAGTKVLVGDGPAIEQLRAQYPDAVFVGKKHGQELARYYSSGDVLVFPSKTDTFGLVMLEALACGTPVAAYPVSGPKDVIQDPRVGVLDDDLYDATLRALSLGSQDCRNYALRFSWKNCAEALLKNLANNRDHWDRGDV
jgi:glycosyltransferase involved in cell wall biosynthesis